MCSSDLIAGLVTKKKLDQDTLDELEYFRNGGILQYVLRQLAA